MKKKIIAAFKAFILTCALLAVITCIPDSRMTVQGGTSVGGIVGDNTTWTEANSPYLITEDVFIDENIALTIEQGVEVRVVGDYGIFLSSNSTLQAFGTNENSVTFTSHMSSSPGAWKGILITAGTDSRVYLNYTEITLAEKAIGFLVSGEITNSVVTIENSRLSDNIQGVGLYTGYTVDNATIVVKNSTIHKNSIGINLHSPFFGSELSIFNNSVINNIIGFCLDDGVHQNTNVNIQMNLFVANDFGVQIGDTESGLSLGSPVYLLQNSIAGNRIGIHVKLFFLSAGGELFINSNNIYSNVDYSFQVAAVSGIYDEYNATYNWWGTTNTTIIDRLIYDFYDDFTLGEVIYLPLLNQSNADAPTIPSVAPEIYTFNISVETQDFNITIFSNSTISNFIFNQTSKELNFNAESLTGTTGFCNISIPADFMWGTFTLYMDNTPLTKNVDYTKTLNDTHYVFSINYEHSSHTIKLISTSVIPDFAGLLFLPFVTSATLLALFLRKKTAHKKE
jgi:hypothetical protein